MFGYGVWENWMEPRRSLWIRLIRHGAGCWTKSFSQLLFLILILLVLVLWCILYMCFLSKNCDSTWCYIYFFNFLLIGFSGHSLKAILFSNWRRWWMISELQLLNQEVLPTLMLNIFPLMKWRKEYWKLSLDLMGMHLILL